ncbi:MAG: hypothetical protein ACRDS0_03610 [Pseudonocardiaceae bacterium]
MRAASDPLPTRFRRWAARQRALADIGVAVLVAWTAAVLGLVLDNVLPGSAAPAPFSPIRLIIMIGSVALLIGSVALRRWIYRGTGTLYSLCLLDETMRDYHEDTQRDAAERHMAVQIIGRRVDLLGREHDGVVDVVQPRQELSRALESALNQDRQDTGYAVAPILLWPAALAVGASLFRTDRMRFLEYAKNTTQEFRFQDKASEQVAEWKEQDHIVVPEPTGDRHGVLLSFTRPLTEFDVDRRCKEFGVAKLVVVRPQPHVQGHRLSGPELNRLAEDLAGCLAELKRAARPRELVVVAFVPKTVALLTGWYLSRTQERFFDGTHLMHHVRDEDRFVAMRVHPSQPTAFPVPQSGA